MPKPIEKVLIVGGGTAGWLTAGLLAAKLPKRFAHRVKISLIEAPNIPTVGVGEGTWPTMRATLSAIGLDEFEFLRACGASFKQGSRFVGWHTGAADDVYYHPFELPLATAQYSAFDLWQASGSAQAFADATCPQSHLCDQFKAPKLVTSRSYRGVSNYGYHLDASKLVPFLRDHCTTKLGVRLITDTVQDVLADDQGMITRVKTESHGQVEADFFIDCTGHRALLLGQHFGIGLKDLSADFPINRALAVRLPHLPDAPIRSETSATAQAAGWVWDIAVRERRGIGYVFSDAHTDLDAAHETLRAYCQFGPESFADLNPRLLKFSPGYRDAFWVKNCMAVGLSAGFLEPLEASAIMLIEESVNRCIEVFPADFASLAGAADTTNHRLTYIWERVVDFLKLHYAMSQRTDDFWQDAANPKTWSERLCTDIERWKDRPPRQSDFDQTDDVFPAASYQYVLYGMGFETQVKSKATSSALLDQVRHERERLSRTLPTNRALLDAINTAA